METELRMKVMMLRFLMYLKKKYSEIENIVKRATLIHSLPAAKLALRTDSLSFCLITLTLSIQDYPMPVT